MAIRPLTPPINTLEMGDLVLIKPAIPVKKIRESGRTNAQKCSRYSI